MKDRDEAWMRVEALAMKHPNYNVMSKGTTNNNMSYATPQHIDNSPPDEDVDTDQTPLTLEKIEARANEVRIDLLIDVDISHESLRLRPHFLSACFLTF